MSSWIVQDGNYGDFKSGNDYRFAVEFFPHEIDLQSAAPTSLVCRQIKNCHYEVAAKIVVVSKSYWVIDAGILLFQEAAPHPAAAVGKGLTGEIELGIDPFFYFENLRHEKGMPSLFYDWRVNRILMETTPWIESRNPSGGTVFKRDAAKESFSEIDETNAWEDDDGRASYVFECELLGPSPD